MDVRNAALTPWGAAMIEGVEMSELFNEPTEDDARDWMASEFGEGDYASDADVDEMAVEVADGTQDETGDDDGGWAATSVDEASSSEGGM